MKINKKYQIVLIVVVFLICMALVLIINSKKIDKPMAVIYKNNEIIKKIDLSSNIESYTFNIEDENGYNVVHVDNNGISIIEASCKDKVCIKAGHIHNSLMPITCLPNKLMIKIENAKKEEVDATVY